MENTAKRAAFKFSKYIIKESSMKIIDSDINEGIDIQIELDASVKSDSSDAEVVLTVDLRDQNDNFTLHLKIVGYFEARGVAKEEKNKFIALNAPAILFPYVRAYVSTMTSQAGIMPIVLPTINLHNNGQELLQRLNAELV